MMIIQCPHCQTRYTTDEKHFGDRPSVQMRCTKCQTPFPVQARAGAGPMAVRHVPIQPHDEFNKRLKTVASPGSVEATTVRGGGRPWLDPGKVVSLVVISGPMKGKPFPVTKPRLMLGPRETDIAFEDSEVSRRHCALEVHGAVAVLVDLGSANGTFVNGQRIENHHLEHMSEFRIGSTTMVFSATQKE